MMSKIDELIKELCPNGVNFKKLNDIAIISGAGVDKKIKNSEKPITLLNFMDVYRNKYINKSIPKMTVTATDAKIAQCNILKGDIFITPTSEVINDIGNSALAIEDLNGVVYSYHIMRIRLIESNLITSMYLNYVFESYYVQRQINKQAKGITRFGLTKSQWEKLTIPIPPLPIQEEIVSILDKFSQLKSQLEAELEAELEARKKQYEYYRNKLLTPVEVNGKWYMNDKECEWKKLGEVCENIASGKNNNRVENGKFPVYGSTGIIGHTDFFSYSEECLLVARVGANAGFVHKANGKYDVSDNTLIIKPKSAYNISFAYFQLLSFDFNKIAVGGGQPLITAGQLKKYPIPIPPLSEQERIVSILDRFDALVNDISVGLPAEIEARRKQYEYYRGKLLTFKT